jgi:hypothetical protein
MALFLAVLQTGAFVVLQHAVVAAEVTLAETAVAYDALCGLLAVLGVAADLLCAHRCSPDGDSRFGWEGEGGESGRRAGVGRRTQRLTGV